jgi:hypothetical protein
MATALIYPVTSTITSGFEWKWRCDSEKVHSKRSFAFYHDCLTDALAHGHHVETMAATGANAPGGPAYTLDTGR